MGRGRLTVCQNAQGTSFVAIVRRPCQEDWFSYQEVGPLSFRRGTLVRICRDARDVWLCYSHAWVRSAVRDMRFERPRAA